MKIFKTIRSSFYNRNFYKKVGEKRLSEVVRYYAKLSLMLSIIGFVLSAIFLVPLAYTAINLFKTEFIKTYPAGLEVSIMNGVISTNLPVGSEPFYIPLPQSFSSANTENGVVSDQYKDIKNLVVLDTKSTTTVTLDSFKSLNTLSLVTSKYIVSYDKNGSIVFSDVSKYPDFVLDQGLIDKVFGLAKFIPIAVPFFMFMIVYGLVFFELFFLLIPAFIFFILSKMIKARRSFSESYKICVYSSTWPAILSVATFFIALKIPFLFTFLVLLIALINTKRDHIEETVVVPEDTEVK